MCFPAAVRSLRSAIPSHRVTSPGRVNTLYLVQSPGRVNTCLVQGEVLGSAVSAWLASLGRRRGLACTSADPETDAQTTSGDPGVCLEAKPQVLTRLVGGLSRSTWLRRIPTCGFGIELMGVNTGPS